MRKIVDQYLNYVLVEKRYSTNTYSAYKEDLGQFVGYLTECYGTPEHIDIPLDHIRSWLASLKFKGISSRSINRKITTLKSFFKYVMKIGLLKQSPVELLSSLKTNKKLPEFLSKEQIGTLFAEIQQNDEWETRNTDLIVNFFLLTGIRVSELVDIKEKDLDLNSSSLRIKGKGGKERLLPIPTVLVESAKSYLGEKQKLQIHQGESFFVNQQGEKLTRKNVYQLVHDKLGPITSIKQKSPHLLRHSFATLLLNNGADINAVKDLLGHASLADTQVYTHNTVAKLKEVHKRSHPKS